MPNRQELVCLNSKSVKAIAKLLKSNLVFNDLQGRKGYTVSSAILFTDIEKVSFKIGQIFDEWEVLDRPDFSAFLRSKKSLSSKKSRLLCHLVFKELNKKCLKEQEL